MSYSSIYINPLLFPLFSICNKPTSSVQLTLLESLYPSIVSLYSYLPI